jgi:hypothetical protein
MFGLKTLIKRQILIKKMFSNIEKTNYKQLINKSINNEIIRNFHKNTELYCDSNDNNISAYNLSVSKIKDIKHIFEGKGICFSNIICINL